MTEKTICDLPNDLVGDKIFSKVPITSLREVRLTCKLWYGLLKNWVLGKAAARQHEFLGFMTVDFKVCSLRFHLSRKEEEEEEDLFDFDLSIKQVDLLSHLEISKVFHCDGLMLCVLLDKSKLVAWNPYLGQTRSISPRTCFQGPDVYALGYDMNRKHKILWFLIHKNEFEIYDLSSNSWRDLEVRPDWKVDPGCRGVSLKGNTYLWAHEDIEQRTEPRVIVVSDRKDFLLCFDYTRERFGQRLPLPFHSFSERTVTLSSVRDEKPALLHQTGHGRIRALEIWVTTKVEPNAVSWSKFMSVDMRPLVGDRFVLFDERHGSFFIDEEEKVVVVFDINEYTFYREPDVTPHYHTAFIIGDDGYYKTVSLGEAPNIWKPPYIRPIYSPPLVCSTSYLQSLVQLN